jgi:hypothetical protein
MNKGEEIIGHDSLDVARAGAGLNPSALVKAPTLILMKYVLG